MRRHCFLIVNPTSGSYSRERLDRILQQLQDSSLMPQLLITASADDAPSLARRICVEEPDPFIIAGGGDGTINGVVNGMIPGKATLGILPLGTANVLARELQIRSIDQAVEKIMRQQTRPMSVGKLETGTGARFFLLMAGAGFDGAVVEGVRLAEKRVIGKGAYVLSALRCLLNWDEKRYKVSLDSKDLFCHSVVICNGAKYGGDFVLAPEADLFSPGFQVVGVSDGDRRSYLRLLVALLLGRSPEGRGVFSAKAQTVEIYGDKAVQIDGDYHCHAPVKITSVEGFLRIIV